MLRSTSILLAAGLTFAAPGQAQTPPATPVAPVAVAPVAAPAAATASGDAAANTGGGAVNPLLAQDGAPAITIDPAIGQPQPGSIGLQQQVTPNGLRAHGFHNGPLLWVITLITLLVLVLLLWVIYRYRRAANPTPSRTSHNTVIEIIWTLVPVLILVLIAVPSIGLLAAQYKPAPDNAVTLKAIGNQWYWSYEYPDNGDIQITANMLKERDQVSAGQRYRTDADGPRLLAADNRVVLPINTPIRLQTTATDVIHSWAVPAFWIKLDAIPGRVNETSFTIEKPGLYFGQCSELCGDRHGFMPIAVEAVTPEVFAQWVHAKGGTMPGETPASGTTDTAAGAAPSNQADAAEPAAAGQAEQ